MNEIQFVTLCAALMASFVWMIGMRNRSRIVRVLGVLTFIGAWLAFRLVQRA